MQQGIVQVLDEIVFFLNCGLFICGWGYGVGVFEFWAMDEFWEQ